MAGRGRGRGRGRGSQMSFDYSQLGFTVGEALPAPVLQPPPTFPPLEYKPIPLKSGPESEYMVALKRDFVEFLHSIRQSNDSSSMIERFSDKYQIVSSDVKENWESQINWDYFPTELNPKLKKSSKRKFDRKGSDSATPAKRKKNIDISNKLDELAKLEDKEDDEEEAKESEKEGDEENENKENPEEAEDEDEEMDDGTDYVNNYFDNGESYFDDEDDNLDDGPIY